MLTAHKIKILKSLDKKKFRQKYNLFLVEGNKIIKEIAGYSYQIEEIFSVNPDDFSDVDLSVTAISQSELKKISFLKNPKSTVAICKIKPQKILENLSVQIILDGIQDPGNLGTIIRLAVWFGVEQIICSEDTVDFHNPKVIQATMGSFLRVNMVYVNLKEYLKNTKTKIIGTDMEGKNLYQYDFPEKFSIVFGNEGNGISYEAEKLLDDKISIPRFGKIKSTESLNVSVAAGIILGQIFSGQIE
jgi:TrmH family RNA methyltransferase